MSRLNALHRSPESDVVEVLRCKTVYEICLYRIRVHLQCGSSAAARPWSALHSPMPVCEGPGCLLLALPEATHAA